MNDTDRSTTRLYALKLVANAADRGGIAGRLEHIPSGRLFAFADGASLVSILTREQAGGYLIDASSDVQASRRPLSHPLPKGNP